MLRLQLEVDPLDLHESVQATVPVGGDLSASLDAITAALQGRWTVSKLWWLELDAAINKNKSAVMVSSFVCVKLASSEFIFILILEHVSRCVDTVELLCGFPSHAGAAT